MATTEKRSDRFETQLRAWGAELDRLKAKVDGQIAAAKKDYSKQGEQLRQEIEARLLKWGYEMEELKSQVGPEAQKLLETLKARQQALKDELATLKGISEVAWGDVKTGVGKAWQEFKTALTRR